VPILSLFPRLADAPAATAIAVLSSPRDASPRLADVAGVEESFDLLISDQLQREKASGDAGEIVAISRQTRPGASSTAATDATVQADTLYVAGVGDASPRSMRRAGAALARRAKSKARLRVLLLGGPPGSPEGGEAEGDGGEGEAGPYSWTAEQVQAFAEGLQLGAYAIPRRTAAPPAGKSAGTDRAADGGAEAATDGGADGGAEVGADGGADGADGDGASPRLQNIDLVHEGDEPVVRRAEVMAGATCLARDLANTPAGDKPPAWLAERAVQAAEDVGLTAQVWEERQLHAEGFGGILAVGSGSERPPRMVRLDYAPEGVTTPHVVLVGKGITFDSGGLSLKPRESMPAMKTDMSGAAAVLATLQALPALGLPVRVTGLLAIAENVPSGSAYRPSDVITQYGGTTVEVLNTDAEGRLVLADALAYAHAHLDPDVVIDIATLTGAATLGLGKRHAAVFSDDADLVEELRAAGATSGEAVWPLPLVADSRAALDSDIADICHISRVPSMSAGAITAALFLREFTGGRRWAHLDIAGPARADADEHEVSKGGTGFGARLLLAWLAGLCPTA
jgi:leucyl aminopeptidase